MELYSVKTVYRITVLASSPTDAYRTVWNQMKVEPGIAIAGVERAKERKRRGLLKSLIFGP
ncbi:MAG: hypothetical protein AAF266_13895 [Planctomycetota bacterium]